MREETVLGVLWEGSSGSVLLVREENKGERLVWQVKERNAVRYFISCKRDGENCLPWEDTRMKGETLKLYFPYTEKRSLSEFLPADSDREELCRRLLNLCMSCRLPWAILQLVLRTDSLNIRKDGFLYITYDMSFEELDPNAGEKDCVLECGMWIIKLLKQDREETGIFGKRGRNHYRLHRERKQKQRRIELLEKKLERGMYDTFEKLYRDINGKRRATAERRFHLPENPGVFYVFLAFGILIFFVAAVTTAVFWFTGEPLLFQLFEEPLRQIGTVLLE